MTYLPRGARCFSFLTRLFEGKTMLQSALRIKSDIEIYLDGGIIANISVKLKDLPCLYIFSISIIVIHQRINPQKYVSFDLIQIIMDENHFEDSIRPSCH